MLNKINMFVVFFILLVVLIYINIEILNTPKRKGIDYYQITVEDYRCKCYIKYITDNYRLDSMIYFKSEGVEYEIDTSLVKGVCIK